MMRTIAAILALSPVLLHAQASAPAQPSSTPVLQASVRQPAAPAAVQPLDPKASIPVRVSTGVTAPKLLHSAELTLSSSPMRSYVAPDRTVVVDMTVDATGKPSNLKVVKSSTMVTDQNVLDAAKHFVFKPGTLDGEAIPVNVELSVTIQ